MEWMIPARFTDGQNALFGLMEVYPTVVQSAGEYIGLSIHCLPDPRLFFYEEVKKAVERWHNTLLWTNRSAMECNADTMIEIAAAALAALAYTTAKIGPVHPTLFSDDSDKPQETEHRTAGVLFD